MKYASMTIVTFSWWQLVYVTLLYILFICYIIQPITVIDYFKSPGTRGLDYLVIQVFHINYIYFFFKD